MNSGSAFFIGATDCSRVSCFVFSCFIVAYSIVFCVGCVSKGRRVCFVLRRHEGRDLMATWMGALGAAASNGARVFVVSALGCGAYRNPPEAVAEALIGAARLCDPRELRTVVVAVHNDHNSRNNVDRFQRVLTTHGFQVGAQVGQDPLRASTASSSATPATIDVDEEQEDSRLQHVRQGDRYGCSPDGSRQFASCIRHQGRQFGD